MKKKSRMLAAMLCAVLMVGVLTVPAYRSEETRLNSSHIATSRMPSSA